MASFVGQPHASPALLARQQPPAPAHGEDSGAHGASTAHGEKKKKKRGLSWTFEAYLNNSDMSDVTFLVGKPKQTRIFAHRFLLAFHSKVFKSILYGPNVKRAVDAGHLVVEVPDIGPTAFLGIMRYLYTERLDVPHEAVLGVLYGAAKFDLPTLKEKCASFIKRSVNADNVCLYLAQATRYRYEKLAAHCVEFIENHSTRALSSDGFVDLPKDCVLRVVQSNMLTADEIYVFRACAAWATKECARKGLYANPENKRAVLRDILPLIRLPLMTTEELTAEVEPTGIVSKDAMYEIFRYFLSGGKTPVSFSTHPRRGTSMPRQTGGAGAPAASSQQAAMMAMMGGGGGGGGGGARASGGPAGVLPTASAQAPPPALNTAGYTAYYEEDVQQKKSRGPAGGASGGFGADMDAFRSPRRSRSMSKSRARSRSRSRSRSRGRSPARESTGFGGGGASGWGSPGNLLDDVVAPELQHGGSPQMMAHAPHYSGVSASPRRVTKSPRRASTGLATSGAGAGGGGGGGGATPGSPYYEGEWEDEDDDAYADSVPVVAASPKRSRASPRRPASKKSRTSMGGADGPSSGKKKKKSKKAKKASRRTSESGRNKGWAAATSPAYDDYEADIANAMESIHMGRVVHSPPNKRASLAAADDAVTAGSPAMARHRTSLAKTPDVADVQARAKAISDQVDSIVERRMSRASAKSSPAKSRRSSRAATPKSATKSPARAAAPRFAIVAADYTKNTVDVKRHILIHAPPGASVDMIDASDSTPTLSQLKHYHAILCFSNEDHADNNKIGDVLAAYVEQVGGGVVVATCSTNSGRLSGKFAAADYHALTPGSTAPFGNHELGSVMAPDHPIMENVRKFRGGALSGRSKCTLAQGANLIAQWDDGTPLVAVKRVAPLTFTATLNFFPLSSNTRKDFWDATTDGGRLLYNAMAFCAKKE